MHIKETFPELYQIRKRPVSIESARARLRDKRGREFWQSLEELSETEGFDELLHTEFPRHASEWDEGTDRRTFLKLMGASLALAGVAGCSYQPPETIVPYVRQPDGMVPGKPLFYATAMPFPGGATPLLVRSNMGRPTKVEGNDLHPASQGAADLYAQASVLGLYDPDRSETIINRGEVRTYTAFLGEISTLLVGQRPKQGAGLRFLTETVASPTLAAQLRGILRAYPGARWYQWEPAGSNNGSLGIRQTLGDFATPIYNFAAADRILSLDSNFLECGPGALRYAREFASRRRPMDGKAGEISRLYSLETTPTNTGFFADNRLAVRPSEFETVVRAIAAGVGAPGAGGANVTGAAEDFVREVVADLNAFKAKGASVVIAGDEQSPAVHALAHAMNAALGNVGKTVSYVSPVEENPVEQLNDLRTLVSEIDAGAVDILVIVSGNPVYTTPIDLKLDEARMKKVRTAVHLSLYEDETSELCHWHIPETHYLETWGDTRAYDGTVTIMQPLITPLYSGKSAYELLAAFTDNPDRRGYDILRDYWLNEGSGALMAGAAASSGSTSSATPAAGSSRKTAATPEFERAWRRALNDGFVANSARQPHASGAGGGSNAGTTGNTQPNANAGTSGTNSGTPTATATPFVTPTQPAPSGGGGQFEIVFRTDPTVYDGRFANNGWLQELPKPLTKLTWDNVAIISPATAERLGVGDTADGAILEAPRRVNRLTAKGGEIYNETLRLTLNGRQVVAPAFILPGQPDNVVTVHLGYGRRLSGRVGGNEREGVRGFNAYDLRTSATLGAATGLGVEVTGEQYQLASTQIHFRMEGRDIVRAGTFAEWSHEPELAPASEHKKEPPQPAGENREPEPGESLYPPYDYSEHEKEGLRGYKWGMAIDVSTCVGCNACIVACQAENNIPVVGKEQVARSREMHWLRVDSYFRGAVENPDGVYFMPVPCMQCENAPCESVCPVHATVHSAEGLNDMVYNRCVGTRYCSNNCPYKVRRFNFLLFQDWDTPSLKMMRNPEVSVRSRGVMEKCTYCVQRIEYAKIESEKEDRRVRDGEIKTACQATCPTESIVFGDLNDPKSAVAKLHAQKRRYDLLADLNTRPRTGYLAAVRNPNEALGGGGKHQGEA
ncbi:MAG TPA: TAT-variant-translocated molybdopterin oxidoreductase [Pyrinomonadaceae bacterium]|jgi:molybdopterin-containing oxidoreductase family iron-sulfur binding subunit|nr:TAT-variant-translocated molybdopterin oxidoreductase [Pyrinomonadaceae bacterium]